MTRDKSSRPRRRLNPASLALLLLALLAPALYNGSPFLFPDSPGYFRSGEASLDAAHWLVRARLAPPSSSAAIKVPSPDRGEDGISTARSVFYGIPMVALYRAGGIWLIALAQAGLAAVVLCAGLDRLRDTPAPRRDQVAIGIVAIVGGLAVYATAVMPDLFAGLLIFATAIVLGFHDRMRATERLGWLALIVLAVLVHKGHLAVFGALVLAAAIAAIAARRFTWPPFAALVLAFGLGWGGHAAVEIAVTRITGRPPVPTAFLLARVVGDGTALPYLDAACGTRDLLLCGFRNRFPMTEDEFLWSTRAGVGVVGHLGEADRRRLARESGAIVIGAIAANPLAQARATFGNMIRQNITLGVNSFAMVTGLNPAVAPGFAPALTGYRDSKVFARQMPLAAMSTAMLLSYVLGFVALAGLVARRPALLVSGDDRAAALQIIIAGVLINACIFSAVSSTADRYQGRVAWLIPLVAITLWWRRKTPLAASEKPPAGA